MRFEDVLLKLRKDKDLTFSRKDKNGYYRLKNGNRIIFDEHCGPLKEVTSINVSELLDDDWVAHQNESYKNKLCFGLAMCNGEPHIAILPIRGEGGGWIKLAHDIDLSELKRMLKCMVDENPDLDLGLVDDGIEVKGEIND